MSSALYPRINDLRKAFSVAENDLNQANVYCATNRARRSFALRQISLKLWSRSQGIFA
jgi:hypothetical protein